MFGDAVQRFTAP